MTDNAPAPGVPTIDLHSHPGQCFRGHSHAIGDSVAQMAASGVTAGLFCAVGDLPVLEWREGAIEATREPYAGEMYRDTQRQLATLGELIDGGTVTHVREPADVARAQADGPPGAILAVEGGDFLESRLERVEEAHEQGVRCIQLVHYRVNELGDIQTAAPHHGGLSLFGAEVIREMNRLGLLVDLAHATHAVTRDACDITTKPLLLSHSLVAEGHPRFISTEHARAVAETGGLVGAWDVGFAQIGFSEYIDAIERMVEAVGVDHVGIGTDMDASYHPPVGSYANWPRIPQALRERGYADADVDKIMGGNFMRVFRAVRGE